MFVAARDELEEQFGAAFVEFHVSEFVDLCGCPHRSIYAEPVTMPSLPPARADVRGPCGLRIGIVTGSRGTRGPCLLGGIGLIARMPAW